MERPQTPAADSRSDAATSQDADTGKPSCGAMGGATPNGRLAGLRPHNLDFGPSASLSAQHPTTTAQEWVCPWVRPTTSEGKRAQRVPCATATMSGERTPARLRLHQPRTQGECQRKAEYMVIGLPRKADGKSHCSDEKAATFVRLHGGRLRLTNDSIRTPAGLLRRGSSRIRSLYKNEAMLPPKKIPLTLWRNEYGCFSENAIALKCFERN